LTIRDRSFALTIVKEDRRILRPYLVVGAFLIAAVAAFVYDARTIIDAEEAEEDSSKTLLLTGSFLNGLQQTQIEQQRFLLTGDAAHLQSYQQEKGRSVNRISALKQVVANEGLSRSLPRIDTIEKTQVNYINELDSAVQRSSKQGDSALTKSRESRLARFHLQQIQMLLADMERDITEMRQATNEHVAFSVQRASVSILVVTILLIAILSLGYRNTSRAFVTNRELTGQLAHEAMHDTLTLLPNRRFFNNWLEKSVAIAQRNNFPIAIMFIDLDGFKQVNDRFGHNAGDQVLRVTTGRFQDLTRGSEVLARLGGDEFAILVSPAPANEALSVLAGRIVSAMAAPINIGSEAVTVGASIGIAVFPRDAETVDSLVRASDEAMYQAKARGKNQYYFASSLLL
jgi:diguanylate cyclase (GGDEF)-like protein